MVVNVAIHIQFIEMKHDICLVMSGHVWLHVHYIDIVESTLKDYVSLCNPTHHREATCMYEIQQTHLATSIL